MEFLKKLILQSKSHLSGLTVSQRAAIALCVVVMVGALAWLMEWSVKPDLVALINQDLTPEEVGRIQARLDDANATYQVQNNRILVKADERAVWLARLGEQQALPDDISVGFDSLMKDSSPFHTMDEQAWRRSVALGNELAQVLRRFTGVADARVFIDKTEKRGLGRAPTVPTASIYVKMKPGAELDKPKVYALASFVAKSVAGMSVKNVGVTDATTGHSYTVPDPADPGSFDDLDDRRRKEEYFTGKLQKLFAHIPGLLVQVQAELDAEARTVEKTTYGKPVKKSEQSETTMQDRGSAGASPGGVANTAKVAAEGNVNEKIEKTMTKEEYTAEVDKTVETSDRMRHGLKGLRASINVPRSHFVAIFKQANANKEPQQTDLEPIITAERAKISNQAKTLLGAADDSQVRVEWFYDTPLAGMVPAEAGAGSEALGLAKEYAGPAGLGALAIVSLLMMLKMVRRASEGPILPGEEPPPPLPTLNKRRKGTPEPEVEEMYTAATPVGEAQVTQGLLVGRELDENSVRSQQLADQVAQMIDDDADAAAGLIKRWVETSK
jgi:flagellar M-ring protein FliF